jgi:hypothetical protein
MKKLPETVKKYRMLLLVGSLIIVSMSLALLVTNISLNNKLQVFIEEVYTEKRIKNLISDLRLAIICSYLLANIPSYFNIS